MLQRFMLLSLNVAMDYFPIALGGSKFIILLAIFQIQFHQKAVWFL